MEQYKTSDFELSHKIRHLSFGVNIPGKTDPIDDLFYETEQGARNINYYLKIVPTTYQRIDGSTLSTNQFSVSHHEKVMKVFFNNLFLF